MKNTSVCFKEFVLIGSNIQLIDPIRSDGFRQGRRGGRWSWGGGASLAVAVMVVMSSAPPQCHDVLEADVCLGGVVHTVWDGHHGNRGDGGAAGPTAH